MSMVRHVWTVICTTIITDRETNATSYINTIEAAGVPSFPALLPPLSIGTNWRKDSDELVSLRIRVKFALPDGSVRNVVQVPDTDVTRRRHRLNIVCGEIEVREPGVHFFVVQIKQKDRWETVCRIPLDVMHVEVQDSD
jgi:hypothetical protein